MGSWNYRVIRTGSGDETELNFHEVHYDEHKVIIGWTENPIPPTSETVKGLRWHLDRMIEALQKPVLEEVEGKLVEITN